MARIHTPTLIPVQTPDRTGPTQEEIQPTTPLITALIPFHTVETAVLRVDQTVLRTETAPEITGTT